MDPHKNPEWVISSCFLQDTRTAVLLVYIVKCDKSLVGLGIMVFTPLSTIFQLNHCGQFTWWSKQEYQEKTTDMPCR